MRSYTCYVAMATFSTLAEVVSSGQFSDYMRYMDRNEQGGFRLMTKEYKQGRSINMPTVSRADVSYLTPKLRTDNTNGRSVFLRPVDRRWVLLDLDDSGYDEFDSIPIIPDLPFSFGVRTSRTSFNLWFYVTNVDTDAQQVDVQRFISSRYYEAHGLRFDPGAMRAGQIGRSPGFRNTKPGRDRFWVSFHRARGDGRFNLTVPMPDVLFQFAATNKRKHEGEPVPEVKVASAGDGSGSGADFGRCMTLLFRSKGTVSIPAMTSTLRNFSSHRLKPGGDRENYFRLTVANARLMWGLRNLAVATQHGHFEIFMGHIPPVGYAYPGGGVKPASLAPPKAVTS